MRPMEDPDPDWTSSSANHAIGTRSSPAFPRIWGEPHPARAEDPISETVGGRDLDGSSTRLDILSKRLDAKKSPRSDRPPSVPRFEGGLREGVNPRHGWWDPIALPFRSARAARAALAARAHEAHRTGAMRGRGGRVREPWETRKKRGIEEPKADGSRPEPAKTVHGDVVGGVWRADRRTANNDRTGQRARWWPPQASNRSPTCSSRSRLCSE